jgi:hypothetical protein
MSDNLKRYCAIHTALKQLCPKAPTGNHARHLQTLAHLVSGIVGSKKSNLPAVASKVPSNSTRESRIKRYSRWLMNERISKEMYFLPYVQVLLASLPPGPLVLVIDGSPIGRDCQALVISVLYKKRALPLAWSVVRGKKGHLSEQMHEHLVRQVAAFLPPERPVLFLGDGEFNGTDLLALVQRLGWSFVCRISKNTLLCEQGEVFSLSELPIEPGDTVEMADVLFTGQGFGPVLVIAAWNPRYDRPLYLVSNLDLMEEAYFFYRRRFCIETFFSDQKSRGFYVCHSHLSDPMRLQRLLLATCLAYLWMICLGARVLQRGWLPQVHRGHRCDLSLFQIGLLWIEHCLNQDWPIPVTLQVLAQNRCRKSVR